jgi:hypothetical protein
MEEFLHQSQVPAYAILPYNWNKNQEVAFDDVTEDAKSKYRKLRTPLQ